MGTEYRYRKNGNGKYDGDLLPVDFEANAASLGALTCRVRTGVELKAALIATRKQSRTSVIVIETAYDERVPGYESWWDVPIAEVSDNDAVKAARTKYEEARKKQRYFF
jgi:3D-(3,5/4)-trihydroxycyclohexane-1,2-dione acylhydrolase (decyclizing)